MTTAPSAPRRNKALAYAEDTLGVQAVYTEAQRVRSLLDDCFSELAKARDKKRFLEDAIETRELEITADEHAKHSGMSVAAMERHLKMELPKDDQLRSLRSELTKVVSDIEGLEYDVKVHDADIRIAVARMNELGGYLAYLAAVKNAGKTGQAGNAGHSEKTGEAQ